MSSRNFVGVYQHKGLGPTIPMHFRVPKVLYDRMKARSLGRGHVTSVVLRLMEMYIDGDISNLSVKLPSREVKL